MVKHKDSIKPGEKFERLTILCKIASTNKNSRWLCRCICGNTTEVSGPNLLNAHVKSCGCLQKEIRKIPEEKNCTKCNSLFPNTTEYFWMNGKYLRPDCKKCCEKRRIIYPYDPSKENKQRKKNNGKIWYEKNHELSIGRSKKWRKENPEKSRITNRKHAAKRRTQIKGLTYIWGEIYEKYALKICSGKCIYCLVSIGDDFFRRTHFDHIVPISSNICPGTVPWNYVPSCSQQIVDGGERGCNQSKGDKNLLDWLTGRYDELKIKQILQRVSSYQKKMIKFATKKGDFHVI